MPTIERNTSAQPRYLQMAREIEGQIDRGGLQLGDRLPSFVAVRRQYGATPATVERVYVMLEKRGLIRREPNRGVFVAEPRPIPRLELGILGFSLTMQHPYYVPLLRGIQEEVKSCGAELTLYKAGWRFERRVSIGGAKSPL